MRETYINHLKIMGELLIKDLQISETMYVLYVVILDQFIKLNYHGKQTYNSYFMLH